MAPPELPRDAPGPDVLEPVEVAPLLRGRVDADAPARDGGDGGGGELLHAHEPLERDERLDPLPRAVRERDGVRVGGARAEHGAERRDDRLARLEHREASVLGARRLGHPPVLADHRPLLEPVLAPDLEVVRVVAGGDLQAAGAEVGLDVLVGDHRERAPHQR